ncbi:MAG: hypothetical protein ACPGSC_05350 [Granulosicoccaceae bacterium]
MFGLDREMGYTHREFFNQAPRTFKNHSYQIEDSTIIVQLEHGVARIQVGPQKVRQITPMMRLPYVEVSIRFEQVSNEEQAKFMRLFDTSYQKGGG